jgi:hypothetical protein
MLLLLLLLRRRRRRSVALLSDDSGHRILKLLKHSSPLNSAVLHPSCAGRLLGLLPYPAAPQPHKEHRI